MTDETEQADDHLAMIAKANGKAPTDRHDVTHTQTVSGPTIDNRNQLSTWALITVLIALFVAATMGAAAIGIATNASYAAQMAEREARLAQQRYMEHEVEIRNLQDYIKGKGK